MFAGKSFVMKEEEDHLTITYKNDISLLAPAQHFVLSYNDIDGKSESMILKPVMVSPAEVFKTKIIERFKQMWIENRYPELAKYLKY